MCGIAGLWCANGDDSGGEGDNIIRRMTQTLIHRGPDDEGYFSHKAAGLYFGHRRLSVVDLSAEGHQPMQSPSGRYVIVFNGEVYNHGALRAELSRRGFSFRGHSDTETIVVAIEEWGIQRAISRFNGMFSFALWDQQRRILTLVRDRLGIKPVYFGWVAGKFVFASELKAFCAVPRFANPISRGSVALLMRHNCIPAPHSIYEQIYKLMPGAMLQIDAEFSESPKDSREVQSRLTSYWSARKVVEQAGETRLAEDPEVATERLDDVLRQAVRRRMEADVPLGAFLSGGVDSSVIVALMQAQTGRSVKTFSIGFCEAEFDEARYARAVARHLHTDHTELYVTSQEALSVIPGLPEIYDEPFSDSSQIPTFLVSRLARQDVTVSLSGDGGDELFGGYNHYQKVDSLWRSVQRIPQGVRLPLSRKLAAVAHLRSMRTSNALQKIAGLAELLAFRSPDELYSRMVSHWSDPEVIVLGANAMAARRDNEGQYVQFDSAVERMMYMDLVSYLPDDILTKVDRASMATSLEVRVPILDQEVVEFAYRLPLHMKIRGRERKWLLRKLLYRYVPRSLIDRPKHGFGIPIGKWLRGPLRDWAEDLLDERRLHVQGILNPGPIRQMWEAHVSGRRNEQYRLWDVLMFEAWLGGRLEKAHSGHG